MRLKPANLIGLPSLSWNADVDNDNIWSEFVREAKHPSLIKVDGNSRENGIRTPL